jgi:hypothetical protein
MPTKHQVKVRLQKLHPQLANTVRLSESGDRSYVGGINVDREHVHEFHRQRGNLEQALCFRDKKNTSGSISNDRFWIRMISHPRK